MFLVSIPPPQTTHNTRNTHIDTHTKHTSHIILLLLVSTPLPQSTHFTPNTQNTHTCTHKPGASGIETFPITHTHTRYTQDHRTKHTHILQSQCTPHMHNTDPTHSWEKEFGPEKFKHHSLNLVQKQTLARSGLSCSFINLKYSKI